MLGSSETSPNPPENDSVSIIALEHFILATRDSGYKGTTTALAELVDNSIQAGARRVSIEVRPSPDARYGGLVVTVQDDGCGMDAPTLREAMRFGGSSRFNDREGLGRYGMGLPNSSLSQARRVEVYSWRRPDHVLMSYLDIDEISRGELTHVPTPIGAALPLRAAVGDASGTLVVWLHCDRLDHKRPETITRKLLAFLGRVFRYPVWSGVEILVNGALVAPVDPLYLDERSAVTGGRPYGDPLEYEIELIGDDGAIMAGLVTVRFSELPVDRWHDLPNEQKQALGISKGAGVSVVRSGREIDYGWHFLSGKRRENYDDWWRCEVQFEPGLDEAFGLTHTKQQIRPSDQVLEIIGEDMEMAARALNVRARRAYNEVKQRDEVAESEARATSREHLLPALSVGPVSPASERVVKELRERHPVLQGPPSGDLEVTGQVSQYVLLQDEVMDSALFHSFLQEGKLVVVVNPKHPFHRKLYGPLLEADTPAAKAQRSAIELLFFAAARSEAMAASDGERESVRRFVENWSQTLASFMKD